jgi:hypothetical protein
MEQPGGAVHRDRSYVLPFWSLVALVVIFFPFSTRVVPAWDLYVVDENRKPLADVMVRETWQHHNVEIHGNEASGFSDATGKVSFPKRTVRASIAERALGIARRLRDANHGFWGITAQALAWEPCYETARVLYRPGKPVSDTVTLRRTIGNAVPCCDGN